MEIYEDEFMVQIIFIIQADPSDCHSYFMCQDLGMGQWEVKHYNCGPGLGFHPEYLVCDWTENVPGCDDKKVNINNCTIASFFLKCFSYRHF